MNVFSYHLVKIPFLLSMKDLLYNPIKKSTKGLIHAEFMTAMTLGAPIFSPSRFLIGQVAIFMQWENEMALEKYLEQDHFGKILAKGWHVRMSFIRKWGNSRNFRIPECLDCLDSPNSPVVAVTIARVKPFALPRFIHWGRPVKKLVKDHPGTTLSLASVKFPNIISTFSIWRTEKEMTDMVHGHNAVENPKRHSNAMKERERKDFHFEFATFRLKPIAEFGSWKGQSNLVPFTKEVQ